MIKVIDAFIVTHRRIRLRVRLLPRVVDVDREYRDGKRRERGLVTHAYTAGTHRARVTATITLPLDGKLDELVPHEVAHGVMWALRHVSRDEDEALATAIGLLSARIFRRLRRMGVAL